MTDDMAPADKAVPYRCCDKCEAAMTHLSDLVPFLGAAPVRIFRCYNCNHVVSEDR
jgi:hypothetical protein